MKTKLITTIGMALVATLALSAPSYADRGDRNPRAGIKPSSTLDQPQSNNSRQKMQMSERKAAAKRLKKLHNAARAQQVQEQVKNHGRHHKG